MNYILLVVLFIGVIIVYIPMPRRKHYRKNKFKLKLKKGTIYSIFAFGFIVVGIILLLSFTKNGNSFLMINNLLGRYFGSVAILWISIFKTKTLSIRNKCFNRIFIIFYLFGRAS